MGVAQDRQHRILTTHVGSLPRPDALDTMMAQPEAIAADPQTYARLVKEAVTDVVRRQAEAGIDIVDDGEQSKPGFVAYVTARITGLEPRKNDGPQFLTTRENTAFPEVYACGHSGAVPPRTACVKPVQYIGHEALTTDLANLKAALQGTKVSDVFVPSASPASVEGWQVNQYYKSDEECLYAIAEAMREEYEAIVAAGFMLQVDDPRIAMHYMLHPEKSIPECIRWAQIRVEALNHALRNVPSDRVRHHTCYGINMGPRVYDMEFRHLVDLVMTIKADYYSFEAANPRHEHEWRIWEGVKLPAGKAILPGVVSHTTVIVEHPDLVAQRILRFAGLVGRENVVASVDCGFASVPRAAPEVHPTIVWEKLRNLAAGARLASKELWH